MDFSEAYNMHIKAFLGFLALVYPCSYVIIRRIGTRLSGVDLL